MQDRLVDAVLVPIMEGLWQLFCRMLPNSVPIRHMPTFTKTLRSVEVAPGIGKFCARCYVLRAHLECLFRTSTELYGTESLLGAASLRLRKASAFFSIELIDHVTPYLVNSLGEAFTKRPDVDQVCKLQSAKKGGRRLELIRSFEHVMIVAIVIPKYNVLKGA